MELGLTGKVALVTGGSGGIGAAICQTMAAEGTSVVVGYYTNKASADTVVGDIRANGGSAVADRVDVRDADSVADFFQQAHDSFGGIDILVNCAGVASFDALADFTEAEWDRIVDTNLKGAYLCCQRALPYLKQRDGGDIVNISSLAAFTGSFEGVAYAASKAGMNSLTWSLALELASANIRVNGVAPGRIHTKFRRTHSGHYFDFMLEQTPQKRLGAVDEVANAVAFIASRASGFITGETLYVAGGLRTVFLGHVTPDPDSKLRG